MIPKRSQALATDNVIIPVHPLLTLGNVSVLIPFLALGYTFDRVICTHQPIHNICTRHPLHYMCVYTPATTQHDYTPATTPNVCTT